MWIYFYLFVLLEIHCTSKSDDSYYIKYIYHVNEVEYEYNTNGVSRDDKYDNILFCKENSPSFCISTIEIRQANERMWLLFS